MKSGKNLSQNNILRCYEKDVAILNSYENHGYVVENNFFSQQRES